MIHNWKINHQEQTQMMQLGDKNIKAVMINMLTIFKKVKET